MCPIVLSCLVLFLEDTTIKRPCVVVKIPGESLISQIDLKEISSLAFLKFSFIIRGPWYPSQLTASYYTPIW